MQLFCPRSRRPNRARELERVKHIASRAKLFVGIPRRNFHIRVAARLVIVLLKRVLVAHKQLKEAGRRHRHIFRQELLQLVHASQKAVLLVLLGRKLHLLFLEQLCLVGSRHRRAALARICRRAVVHQHVTALPNVGDLLVTLDARVNAAKVVRLLVCANLDAGRQILHRLFNANHIHKGNRKGRLNPKNVGLEAKVVREDKQAAVTRNSLLQLQKKKDQQNGPITKRFPLP